MLSDTEIFEHMFNLFPPLYVTSSNLLEFLELGNYFQDVHGKLFEARTK